MHLALRARGGEHVGPGGPRFAEAVEAFRRHLDRHPRDLKALLELGITHLLNASAWPRAAQTATGAPQGA